MDARERYLEAAALLAPAVKALRLSKGTRGDSSELSMKDLRQLAIAWGLPSGNENFWAQHASVESLARVLARTARAALAANADLPHLDALRKPIKTPAAMLPPDR